jgi:hypothetical protein
MKTVGRSAKEKEGDRVRGERRRQESHVIERIVESRDGGA